MVAYQWFVELDMLFREEVMRMAYGIFPYLQNLVVVFRNRSAYIRQIIAQVIVYISVVGKFRLMQCVPILAETACCADNSWR